LHVASFWEADPHWIRIRIERTPEVEKQIICMWPVFGSRIRIESGSELKDHLAYMWEIWTFEVIVLKNAVWKAGSFNTDYGSKKKILPLVALY
jgi:hypothetical protein